MQNVFRYAATSASFFLIVLAILGYVNSENGLVADHGQQPMTAAMHGALSGR
ncbi:hypothetical protein L1787_04815 [Acuticoccus sp. M5D2P5]|uniref:hypothetical protein n=1 Tax=Acuticoccus kalidii TaxID=2910977 RepID=UPI001F22D988|nr:hypothetical protein [Acuticoccus kalidii]MCF3932737.1 hypothetical protein [Acuticoccus kalidii]